MLESNTRVYELGYLLVPTMAEPEVPAKVDALKALITKGEGTVLSESTPEFIDLAYTMEKDLTSKKYKYSQAYFGWVKFESDPSALETLKKALDGDVELVRYILVKTSAHNTIVFKKPKIEAKRESLILEGDLLDEELPDDGLVDDQSLDHERLPSVEEDLVEAPVDNASKEA